MKIIEILGGLKLMISEEEKDFIDKVKKNNGINLSDLNDRELELADMLLRKNAINIDDYRVNFNDLQDLEYVKW